MAIYTLCKRHNRHAVILGTNQTWMTLENTFLDKQSMLLFSDLILINLGGGKYGKIKLLNNKDKHSKFSELLKTPELKRIDTTQKCRESSKSKTTGTKKRLDTTVDEPVRQSGRKSRVKHDYKELSEGTVKKSQKKQK